MTVPLPSRRVPGSRSAVIFLGGAEAGAGAALKGPHQAAPQPPCCWPGHIRPHFSSGLLSSAWPPEQMPRSDPGAAACGGR